MNRCDGSIASAMLHAVLMNNSIHPRCTLANFLATFVNNNAVTSILPVDCHAYQTLGLFLLQTKHRMQVLHFKAI